MKLALITLSAALLASCAPSTPDARIAANPAAFQHLGAKHQELVRQGRIDTGMPTAAVALAWGAPDRRFDGSDGKATTSRWDYDGARPIYTTGMYGGYGYGYRGRDRYAYSLVPEVTYIPYRRASVWFRNDLVTRWESSR
jgi:hypothetical protein